MSYSGVIKTYLVPSSVLYRGDVLHSSTPVLLQVSEYVCGVLDTTVYSSEEARHHLPPSCCMYYALSLLYYRL